MLLVPQCIKTGDGGGHLLSLRCDQAGQKPPTPSFKSTMVKYDFSIDWLLKYYALVESSESRAGKTPVLCDLYSNERDKSLHHDMKLSTRDQKSMICRQATKCAQNQA